MISFSYQSTQREKPAENISNKQWERDITLRNQLNEQEEKNRQLQAELIKKQEEVGKIEKDLAKEGQVFSSMAEDTEKFRMYLGKVKVKGSGVEVSLSDGDYDPNEPDINSYLVHEHHVFKVVNELYISGATAIAINGQRLSRDSYILCNGPVITVDGYPHPAPFVITAIGDPDVLVSALNITGGVKDQLVNDNVVFSLEEKTEIFMEPILGS